MKGKISFCALVTAVILGAAEPACISHTGDLERVCQAVLNQIKKDGTEIESARRTPVSRADLISDTPSQTTVRVSAYERSATRD
jgi:hypothetical protein